ncbi:hypothetical protein QZH41_007165 [Actinostola sp. cb2023]|nr:hypothetical protein QZH41_007165 [Actinostola sp. cb2023]
MSSTVEVTNASFTSSPPQASFKSPLWYWLLTLLIVIVTNIGNGMVIYLIITRRSLHLTNNYYIFSLAVADICTGIFVIPGSYICEQLQTCNISLAFVFYNTFFFASVANVCALTLDRYISIVIPLKYFLYMNNKRVIGILCASWIIPFIIAVIPETYSYSGEEIRQKASRIYEPIQMLVFVVLPIALMLMVYARIYIIARRISKQTNQTNNQLRYNDDNANDATENPESYKRERRERRNREGSVAVLGAVIILFALCWMVAVYNTICQIFQICPYSHESMITAQLLLHLNSSTNPIVYAALKKDIRRELKRLLCGRARQSNGGSFGNNSTYSFATSAKLELQ